MLLGLLFLSESFTFLARLQHLRIERQQLEVDDRQLK